MGKRFALATIERGAVFGTVRILGVSSPGTSAEATEDSVVWALDVARIQRLIRARPGLTLRIVEALSRLEHPGASRRCCCA